MWTHFLAFRFVHCCCNSHETNYKWSENELPISVLDQWLFVLSHLAKIAVSFLVWICLVLLDFIHGGLPLHFALNIFAFTSWLHWTAFWKQCAFITSSHSESYMQNYTSLLVHIMNAYRKIHVFCWVIISLRVITPNGMLSAVVKFLLFCLLWLKYAAIDTTHCFAKNYKLILFLAGGFYNLIVLSADICFLRLCRYRVANCWVWQVMEVHGNGNPIIAREATWYKWCNE